MTNKQISQQWWKELSEDNKEDLMMIYFPNFRTSIWKDLTKEEVLGIWEKEHKPETIQKGLYTALEAIVKEWAGEGVYKELPEYKTSTDEHTEGHKYWSPGGKMVKSETIHKAIEALKKANTDYKP